MAKTSSIERNRKRAQLVKILNNGNVQGFPVLRAESVNGREYRPVAYQVYGPKIVAMRTHFDDPALESRFITETSGDRSLRADIPINLPRAQKQEAEELRNKLLMYRFRHFDRIPAEPTPLSASVEARINQIYSPLAAVIGDDEEARKELRQSAQLDSARLKAERNASMEAHVLTVLRCLMEKPDKGRIAIKDVAMLFDKAFSAEYERPVTHRWLGFVIRRKLNLVTHKSNGNYMIPFSEQPKLKVLFDRYGVTAEDAQALAERISQAETVPSPRT